MTWSKNKNEPSDAPEVFFHSQALTQEDARKDLRKVLDRMMERKGEDGVPDGARMLFHLNSVNSFIDVSWVKEGFENIGAWTYTVWLLPLGEKCLEHEDGTDHFVMTVKFATFDMVYDYYYDKYGDEFETTVCQPECYWWVPEYSDTPSYIIM